jgi:hypothetical protein
VPGVALAPGFLGPGVTFAVGFLVPGFTLAVVGFLVVIR